MQPQVDQRRKIRVTGKESVVDVARIVFKDPRLATLIGDLNPALPQQGAIAPNTVVTCPSKTEAMVFAKKMGFSLGFDEKGTNGTRQKRAWAKMQGPGQASHAGIDAADAARQMLGQKLAAAEVGKRLVKLCTPERLDAFLASDVDAALKPVQQAARLQSDFPKAKARLNGAVAIIDATLRPAGLLAVLEAHVDDATRTAAVLTAVLAPAPTKVAVVEQALRVTTLVARARELVKIERGARDATFAADKDGAALQALCAALVDRVEPVSGERLKVLGLDEMWTALSTHLQKLKDMLKKHEELLPRSGAACISALAHGTDGSALTKPWPLVAAVVRGLKDPIDQAPIHARDLGLGGLVTHHTTPSSAPSSSASSTEPSGLATRPAASMEGGPVVSAASLQARAASGARSVDEGTAIADRLAQSVCHLVELARPVVGDAGPAPMRRAKRRAHFDDVVIAKGAPQGEAVSRLVDELFADARRTNHVGVDRVQRPQQLAARDVSKLLAGTITVHQKNVSELARAIVVVACAIDRELGTLLLRPTGREAFKSAVEKHGGKLLSKAGLVFAEPPTS
jgi:hypothetical protein